MRSYLKQGFGLGSFAFASFLWGSSTKTSTKQVPETTNDQNVGLTGEGGGANRPSHPESFFKFGFPGPLHDLERRDEFVSCYDRRARIPYWVLEEITKESLKAGDNVNRKYAVFKEDERIPINFRARLRDYFRSGYDRGHHAPAADAKFSQQALNDTFYLTNISPQVGDQFNRDYWAHFEEFARTLTQKYDSVKVLTGGLFLPRQSPTNPNKYVVEYEVIGSPPSIAVPTHFYKLIVGEKMNTKDISVAAFVLPNAPIKNETPLKLFQVPLDDLEKASGLELLYRVPPSNKKDLCRDVRCEIVVREFKNAQSNALPPPSNSGLLK